MQRDGLNPIKWTSFSSTHRTIGEILAKGIAEKNTVVLFTLVIGWAICPRSSTVHPSAHSGEVQTHKPLTCHKLHLLCQAQNTLTGQDKVL